MTRGTRKRERNRIKRGGNQKKKKSLARRALLLSKSFPGKTKHNEGRNITKKSTRPGRRLTYETTAVAGSEPPKPPKAPIPCACTAGNEFELHCTAQMHEPSELSVPVPVVRPVPPVLLRAVLVAVEPPSVAVRASPPLVVVPVVPLLPVEPPLPVMALPVPVPFWAMAISWNMAWVLAAVGLMEKVIPLPQWPFWRQ